MLIGLAGDKRAGKDTFYERATLHFPELLPTRVSFAGKLYASLASLLGVPVEWLYDNKDEARFELAIVETGPHRQWAHGAQSIRSALERYGEESHRQVFGADFWLDACIPEGFDHAGRLVFVTDVRYPNEAERIRAVGGHVVRVIDPDAPAPEPGAHTSRQPLHPSLVDVHVLNDRAAGIAGLDQLVVATVLGLM